MTVETITLPNKNDAQLSSYYSRPPEIIQVNGRSYLVQAYNDLRFRRTGGTYVAKYIDEIGIRNNRRVVVIDRVPKRDVTDLLEILDDGNYEKPYVFRGHKKSWG